MELRHGLYFGLICILAAVFANCSQAPTALMEAGSPMGDEYGRSKAMYAADAVENEMAAGIGESASDGSSASLATLAATQPDRYLIKNAQVVIETDDIQQSSDALLAAVQALGGYVSRLQHSDQSGSRATLHATVRVPSKDFESALSSFEDLGRVLEKEISTDDVTEEYVDTDAKIRNMKQTEERLLDHLKNSVRLEDTLNLEREIGRIRGEIERMEGRLRFLSEQVSFSTFDIVLQEAAKAEPLIPGERYSTGHEASQALGSLLQVLLGLWTLAIWVGIWAVLWAPLALAGYVGLRFLRRKDSVPGG